MSDKGEDWVVDGSEIDPEEHKRYLARLGNIAHRYPIRDIWDVMSDMSIEGAALYSLGIDPDAIQREMEWPEDNDLERLPSNYQERLSIIKSAVRAGAIKRVKVNGSDPGGWGDDTRIRKASLLKWCEKNPDAWVHAEKTPDHKRYQPKAESVDTAKAEQTRSQPESTHDPLPLDGIARMFVVDRESDEKNINKWKGFAHNAKRNGLLVARTQKIGGTGQSWFDPVKVGNWLVKKGKMPQEKVDRILLNNLPTRSAHLKDIAAL